MIKDSSQISSALEVKENVVDSHMHNNKIMKWTECYRRSKRECT